MDDAEESLRSALVGNVRDIERQYGYPDLGRAFQHWSAINILGLGNEDVEDFLEDALGKDGGIDYFHRNPTTKTVKIVQAKFSEDLNAKIGTNAIGALYDVPKRLANSTACHSLCFQKYQRMYKKACADGYTTNLIFVIAGNLSDDSKEFIKLKNQDLADNITFDYFEIKDLLGLIGNPNSPACTLHPFESEYFVSKQREGRVKKMVATITADELKNIYELIGAPTLFSLNPRSYLGHSGISRKITGTIHDDPSKLWHYDNGISAICKEFTLDEKTGAVNVKNLKIVNGCQTITTLSKESVLPPDASVVFRLSETDDVKFRKNISNHTNRQNRILSPDLASDHRYLLELEQRFAMYRPFFWERKKGTSLYLDKEQNKRIVGKRDLYIIKNLDVARLKLAYTGRPHLSIQLSQQKLFDGAYEQDGSPHFGDLYKDADPRDFIVPHVLHYWLNAIKKRLGKEEREGDTVKDKNMRFLLKYSIGKYYVIGLIGKILQTVDGHGMKNRLKDGIINTAVNYDDRVADKLIQEIEKLVGWVAFITPKILPKPEDEKDNEEIQIRPLYDHLMYELRDGLSKANKLNNFYIERQSLVHAQGHESFEVELKAIFKL